MDPAVGRGADQYAEVPAIAIPTRGKLEFECPPEHLHALRGYLRDVTHILTVGWRAQEESFLELCRKALEDRPVKGLVVAIDGGESAEIALRLQEALPLASSVEGSRVKGFSNLILSGSSTLETFGTLVTRRAGRLLRCSQQLDFEPRAEVIVGFEIHQEVASRISG